MSSILDGILVKVNTLGGLVAASDRKLVAESTRAADAEEALSVRIASLETMTSEMAAELIAKETKLQEQKARVDELVNQLTQLGVDAGI